MDITDFDQMELEAANRLDDNMDLLRCPNCNTIFDGIECNNCGFDAYCFDPNWD